MSERVQVLPPSEVKARLGPSAFGRLYSTPAIAPWSGSRKAMEKMPAESGPRMIGVSKTCQVCPRSREWKTREVLPPVANQMLESPSAAEAAGFVASSRGAESPVCHDSGDG